MWQILSKYRTGDSIFLIPLVLLSLYRTAGHAFWRYFTGRGLPQTPDSDWYVQYARNLAENLSIGLNINEILYLGYNLLLTLLLSLFKTTAAVVLVQSVVASLSIILVYKTARLLFSRNTALLAGLFYLAIWDITLWSIHVLSDSFFVSLVLLCVYLLLRATEPGQTSCRWLFAGFSLYMCFFRPTGILIMAMMLLYIAGRIGRDRARGFVVRYRWGLGVGLAMLMTVSAVLYFRNALDPLFHSLQYNAKLVLYNVYAKGWIYDKSTAYDYFFRPDYRIDVADSLVLSFLANNWESVSVLYFRRAIAFLGTWTWESQIRTPGDLLFFLFKLLPSILFAIGTVAALRDGKFGRASILWLIILAVFSFCIFLFIDAMYRYRFPALPFVAIIAAYGTEKLLSGGRSLVARFRTARQ